MNGCILRPESMIKFDHFNSTRACVLQVNQQRLRQVPTTSEEVIPLSSKKTMQGLFVCAGQLREIYAKQKSVVANVVCYALETKTFLQARSIQVVGGSAKEGRGWVCAAVMSVQRWG